jgi:hypothetical protein
MVVGGRRDIQSTQWTTTGNSFARTEEKTLQQEISGRYFVVAEGD